jgi:pyridoxamine 5'-phosphate oxidase family protein
MFSQNERNFLKSQSLARIATASRGGEPDVAPVGFEFDGEHFYVGGLDVQNTLKYKNALTNPRAAIVFDDLQSTDPWTPRGIKVRGAADIVERQGRLGTKPYIRIKPEIKWTWGIDEPAIRDGKSNVKRYKL